MKKEKSQKKSLPKLPSSSRWLLPFDGLVFAVLMIVGVFMPAISYTYNKVAYDLPFSVFLTGKAIAGGTVQVAANPLVWLILLCGAGIAILSVLYIRLNRKVIAAASAALAIVGGFSTIIFMRKVEGIVRAAGGKRVGAEICYLIILIAAGFCLLSALRTLHNEKVLTDSYNIIAFAFMTAFMIAAPFAQYTYKKVTHPFTAYDLWLGKEIATDTMVATSIIPLIILLCCAAMVVLALLKDRKPKLIGGLLLLAAAVVVACLVIIMVTVKSTLKDAKTPETVIYGMLPVLSAVIVFIEGLVILKKQKSVSALDFMMVPGLVYLLINNYLPMFGISLAFKKIDFSVGIWNSPWCGFSNFTYLFTTKTAWIITRNTILYNIVFIIVGLFTGLVVGICLAAVTKKVVQTFFQTTILLPQLVSMIIVAYIVYAFISNEAGFINKTFFQNMEVNFYGEEKLWPFLLVFINNWKQLGYNSVIFLSSIVGIDQGLYEAASVDGCGPWKQIWNITLPQLKPTIITLFLLQVGKVFYSDFGLFYQVTMDSGALYDVTQTIDTYVYRALMVSNNLSTASAASAFQSICGFVLVFTVNMIVRKIDRDNALF